MKVHDVTEPRHQCTTHAKKNYHIFRGSQRVQSAGRVLKGVPGEGGRPPHKHLRHHHQVRHRPGQGEIDMNKS